MTKRLIDFETMFMLMNDTIKLADGIPIDCYSCSVGGLLDKCKVNCPIWQSLDVPETSRLDVPWIKCPSCGKAKPQDEMNGQFCYKCTVDFDVWG